MTSYTRESRDLILGKKKITERVIMHWNKLPKEMTESSGSIQETIGSAMLNA